jgi:hypothetical protein
MDTEGHNNSLSKNFDVILAIANLGKKQDTIVFAHCLIEADETFW